MFSHHHHHLIKMVQSTINVENSGNMFVQAIRHVAHIYCFPQVGSTFPGFSLREAIYCILCLQMTL